MVQSRGMAERRRETVTAEDRDVTGLRIGGAMIGFPGTGPLRCALTGGESDGTGFAERLRRP